MHVLVGKRWRPHEVRWQRPQIQLELAGSVRPGARVGVRMIPVDFVGGRPPILILLPGNPLLWGRPYLADAAVADIIGVLLVLRGRFRELMS